MTNKQKAKTLDITGALISFVAPASAAIAEFPHVQETVTKGGEGSFMSFLHISAAAFSIIVILFAITAWRFFANRIKLPKSGLIVSTILFAVAYGVEQFIHSFRIILFWAVIGCAIATIMYFVADRLRGAENG